MRHDGPACCLQRRAPGGPRSSLLGAPLSAGQRARSVLRLREGDCLEVCDGRGNLVAAVLRGITHQKRAYAEAVEGVRQARARARLPARAASAMAVGCRDGRAVSGAAPRARHEAFIEDRCKSACLPACWLSFSIQCLDHGLCCARCCHVTRLAGGALGGRGGMRLAQGRPRRLAGGEVHRAGRLEPVPHPDGALAQHGCALMLTLYHPLRRWGAAHESLWCPPVAAAALLLQPC